MLQVFSKVTDTSDEVTSEVDNMPLQEQNQASSFSKNIPGLVIETEKTKKKKRRQDKEVLTLKRSDFLKNPTEDKLQPSDFEFTDVSEYESCSDTEGTGFFKKPPPKETKTSKRNLQLSPETDRKRVRSLSAGS